MFDLELVDTDSNLPKTILIMPNSDVYYGEYSNQLPNGIGFTFHHDGTYSDGYFLESKLEVFGRIIYNDGETYIGQWKND